MNDYAGIGKCYGLRVIQVDDQELERIGMDRNSLVDHSFICGDEVHLGFYDDPEKKTASLFHEIGHRLMQTPDHDVAPEGPDFKVAPELIAWMLGFREAARHGVHFSETTLEWALNQALSYRGYQ